MFADKIRARRKALGVYQEEIARRLGVSKSTISDWETGKRSPDVEEISRIAEAYETTVFELMGWDNDEWIDQIDDLSTMPSFRAVPLIGSIACGTPITAEENVEDEIPLPEYINADFCLTCKGDSMIDARIFDGDIVFIHKQDDVENGEIAAVLIDGEATLKRVKKTSSAVILQPENKNYDLIILGEDPTQDVRIIGKAVHFLSRVR